MTRRWGRSAAVALAVVLGTALGTTACTSSGAPAPSTAPGMSTTVRASTPLQTSSSVAPSTGPPSRSTPTPLDGGPTRVTGAARCPLLDRAFAQDTLGMRLARITVLRSGGRLVGCRIYALQNSPLHNSEHLPGPHQPAVEVRLARYRTSVDAHNALALVAGRGSEPQQHDFGRGASGVCFRIVFDRADRGRDWACGFSARTTLVIVRTVVTSPALNAVLVTRAVRRAVPA